MGNKQPIVTTKVAKLDSVGRNTLNDMLEYAADPFVRNSRKYPPSTHARPPWGAVSPLMIQGQRGREEPSGKRLLADLVLESLHRCARLFAARLPASPAAAAPACASHSSPPCFPAAALDSTSSTQPPFTAPGPHPVGAYSENAAQELTTNGICQKNYCLLTEVKVG
ncbi:hypothetical protein J6590_094262 [Homalodisca vitripennis]|nr:hypothetical protein J6590_094262 [Homalodisca vitripennis]